MKVTVLKGSLWAAVVLAVLATFTIYSHASDSTSKISLETSLSGASFNGAIPHGRAEYEVEDSSRRLLVELNSVDLPASSIVDVWVNGVKYGRISVSNHGGTLLLSTFAHQTVPFVSLGNRVVIKFGATTVLAGKF